MVKPKNKNYKRIDKKILDAFKSLIKTEDEAKISVANISRLADINRTTFYLHYKGIWEIIDKCEDSFINDIIGFIRLTHFDKDINNSSKFFDKVNEYIEKDKVYILKLISLSRISKILTKLDLAIIVQLRLIIPNIEKRLKVSIVELYCHISTFTGGIVNSYLAVLKGAIDTDLKTLSKIQSKIYINMYNELFLPDTIN